MGALSPTRCDSPPSTGTSGVGSLEIRVQKRRVVSEAPEAWFGGCSFMDFSLCVFRKPRPTLAGQGRVKSEKNAVGFSIICGITRG